MIWSLLLLANAQSPATLVEGDTLLQPCLDLPECEQTAVSLMSENMAEYGFTWQVDPIGFSALGGKGMGLVTELRLDSVALGPPNVLEQQVFLPPAIPRLGIGYQFGSYTFDEPYPQVALGVTVLPPFAVLGGTILGAQADTSAALPLGTPRLWLGAEAGGGVGQLAAPILGTPDQLKSIPEISPYVQRKEAQCTEIGPQCLDTFQQWTGHLRLGLSIEPIPAVFMYTRGAAVFVQQRLRLAYDNSVWESVGWQPQIQAGGGFRAGDKYQATLGAVVAQRPPELSVRGRTSMVKIVATTSFRFGDPRYWKYREPEADASGPDVLPPR